jgi:uncharacterized protein (TIGR01777 family)
MSAAARTALRVAVTGASGLIGRRLLAALHAQGHSAVRLVRGPAAAAQDIPWNPALGQLDSAALEGLDGVVHLAGASLAAGRWTARRKAEIRGSRVAGTRLLARALAGLRHPPHVLICASAVGYYGHCEQPVTSEDAPAGQGFLAEVCAAWEAAAEPARHAGLRVTHLRIGLVLAREGGALAAMLPAFRLGLGGPIGSGRQGISWIAAEDLIAAILAALEREDWAGPLNAVAPHPVTQREFARVLGRVLGRPAVLPLPAVAVRLGLGEMGRCLLLEGAQVLPARLLRSGFQFQYPELEPALRAVLHRSIV